jgi:hypothetical protein
MTAYRLDEVQIQFLRSIPHTPYELSISRLQYAGIVIYEDQNKRTIYLLDYE